MSLIPGLPDDLVCMDILPRLPWYTRPVMASLSKSLKQAIEDMDPKLMTKVDMEGQAVIFSTDGSIFLEDPECSTTWRRLPKLTVPRNQRSSTWATVTDGMVVVWTYVSGTYIQAVFKLDLSKPVLKWDAIVDSPQLDDSKKAAVFRGHLYYNSDREKTQKTISASQPAVLRQYSLRTGQVLNHELPEGVRSVWCAGDDRHLHALADRTQTIFEFDTTTFQWKQIKQGFPWTPRSIGPSTGNFTKCIQFNPNTREWESIYIEHPSTHHKELQQGSVFVASFGFMYAIYCSPCCIWIWKSRIDFTKGMNTTWELIYTGEHGVFRSLSTVCWYR